MLALSKGTELQSRQLIFQARMEEQSAGRVCGKRITVTVPAL